MSETDQTRQPGAQETPETVGTPETPAPTPSRLVRRAVAPDPECYDWLLRRLFGGYRGQSPTERELGIPAPAPEPASGTEGG